MIHSLDATAIAERIAAGDLGAGEAVAAHLEAVEDVAALNAFTSVQGDLALARAATLDAAAVGGSVVGPLHGVPVVVKDLIDHEGRVTTCGSSFYRRRAEHSAPCVARLEAAGAIVIGRTGLHEFAFGFSSENDWFGPVHNPWDPATSPGGSSGGSAAAVAAGLAPIGIGTDTGGSVRVPAAMVGAVGLKVTHGRIPISGVFPLAASLDTVGPITRSVRDAALAYRVMAGDDPEDPWSAPRAVTVPESPAPLAGLTVGVPHPWVDRPLGRDVRAAFSAALDRLSDAGAAVVEIDAPLLTPPGMISEAAYGEIATVHRAWFAEHPERYGPAIRDRLGEAIATDAADFAAGRAWRAGLRHALERILDDCDLLATPATAVSRKVIGVEQVETEAGPESYRRALSWFSALVNHAGVPALSLPVAVDGAPPPSIQLIAPHWAEARLLAAGMALEELGIAAVRSPG